MADTWRSRRELFVAIGSIVIAAAALYVAFLNHVLWVLVPIPAAIGLMYHLLNLSGRYQSRRAIVEEYRTFSANFDKTWSGRDNPEKVSEDLSDDLDSHAPTMASMIWAASLLTSVFALPALVSHGGARLSATTDPALTQVSTSLDYAQSTLAAATPSLDAAKKAVQSAQQSLKSAKEGLSEAQRGLVYAGLGVWVLIVFRTIGRSNAGGLNARFLITASLRAAVAIMLGFFAGAASYFKDMEIAGPTAYFLIGIAYPMFYDSLIDKAYKLFGQAKSTTKELPLKMIDGVDDDTADILTELNVATLQHVATSDPGVLTIRSLYPFNRVVDWIDQAILITYFRENIGTFRNYGVRGVIDFVSLMDPILKNTSDRDEAEKTLAEIAGKINISTDALYTLGLSIYYDYKVNLLCRLWQHNLQTDGYATERSKSLTPSTSERIPITSVGTASFSAFVNERIDVELRREAAERAAKFREQNPDTPKPSEEQMNFTDAYAAAQQRATIGANPKASAQMKEVYEQAFLGALG